MDLKDIKAIIDLMKKNSISEFEMEKQDFKIRLKRVNANAPIEEAIPPANVSDLSIRPSSLTQTQLPAGSLSAGVEEVEIKSPMIGTFYRSPSPDSGPYVEIGTEVTPESIVCIIEAMKVMNEIKAEVRGVITQVVAENGKPVEFGQPLFKVRPL